MWQPPMGVGQRQPPWSLTPREVRGDALGAPRAATMALALRQGMACNKAGGDGGAGWP
jgi:hypothetical protein